MPEGPSLVILREQAQVFEGRRILRVEGNTTIDKALLKGRTVQAIDARATPVSQSVVRAVQGASVENWLFNHAAGTRQPVPGRARFVFCR